MFGDNKSVVDSSMVPHIKLHKRHTALSLHRIREAIAGDLIQFIHISGKYNASDVLSKHWAHADAYINLQPLLFYRGDTSKCWTEHISKQLTNGNNTSNGKQHPRG